MEITLKNVRLSYPNIFKPKTGPEGGEPKYSAAFIMDKTDNEDVIEGVRAAIKTLIARQWPDAAKQKGVKVCLRDGSEKPDTAGYGDGVKFISASNKMPPAVVDKNPRIPLTESSGKPYAGCVVNAHVRLWAQDNKFGKRINAQLQAVQFVAEGEAFGDAPINPENVFADVGGGAETSPFNPDGAKDDDEPF